MKRSILAAMDMMLPGSGDAQEILKINFPGVMLEAPIPAGYCLPRGDAKETAELMATLDTKNITHAMLLRCEYSGVGTSENKDYYLVKSPRYAIGTPVSRADLLAEMAQHFGRAEWKSDGKAVREIIASSNRSVSDALDTPTEVKGDFGDRGTDTDCAYIGGEAAVSVGDVSQFRAARA